MNLAFAEPSPAGSYRSRVVPLYLDHLDPCPEGQLLDVGPVSGSNIHLFAGHVKRLFVCDMFLRLQRDRRQSLPPSQTWAHLDYPARSFNGIQLWDLIDRLDDGEAGRLVERCHKMLKPRGAVMVFAAGEKPDQSQLNSFTIGEDFQVSLRPQPHLDLPFHYRHNREIMTMMAPFHLVKSFIYRNGIREFLFQNNK